MSERQNKTHIFYEKLAKTVIKYRLLFLILLAAITALSIFGLFNIKMDNSIESWFMDGAEIKKANDEFTSRFGNNDYVAFLIEAEDVFAPEALSQIRDFGDTLAKELPFAQKVTSIAEMEFTWAEDDEIIIDNLVPSEIPQDPAEIELIREKAFSKSFLVNRLFTDDSKLTWLFVELSPFPKEWKGEYSDEPINLVGKTVLNLVRNHSYDKLTIKPTGMPVMAVEDIEFGEKEMGKLFLISIIISILLLIVLVRSVRGIIIPLITTFISIIIIFGFMGILGIKVNASIMTVPAFLGYAVSIGYSIHIYNHWYRNFKLTGKRKESVITALKETGWPLLFSALTTTGSLLSFYFIMLRPLQWLGVTSAALIFVIYIVVLILNPCLLSIGKDSKEKAKSETRALKTDRYFTGLAKWVFNNSLPIIIIYFILTGLAIYGMTKVEINLSSKKTYGLKVDFIRRFYEIAETPIGSFLSYDLTLKFDDGVEAAKDPEVLKKFEDFIETVKKRENSKRVSSILDIVKDMNQLLNEDDPDYYKIPDNQSIISEILFLYELSGGTELLKWVSSDYSTIRLMVELGDMDTKAIISDLDFLKAEAKKLFPEATCSITGSMAEYAALNQYISAGQIKSLAIALCVIMVLLMLSFRSIKLGLIGMIPNITPALAVGGIMGFSGITLDFVTVTMVPMILGLAVDDTIHFLSHAKEGYLETGEYRESIFSTFRKTGRSLFMTSIIIISAFSVYLLSIENMFINLGLFVTIGVAAALLSDYLVTPLLIYWLKPFGKKEKSNKIVINRGEEKQLDEA